MAVQLKLLPGLWKRERSQQTQCHQGLDPEWSWAAEVLCFSARGYSCMALEAGTVHLTWTSTREREKRGCTCKLFFVAVYGCSHGLSTEKTTTEWWRAYKSCECTVLVMNPPFLLFFFLFACYLSRRNTSTVRLMDSTSTAKQEVFRSDGIWEFYWKKVWPHCLALAEKWRNSPSAFCS